MSNELYSIADMAEKLREQTNRVAYMVSKHRIKHVRRVGATRVFNQAALDLIKESLFSMRIQK